MYRYFHGSDRNSIPAGLPSRLVDPMLRTIGEQPQFLRIGEGNNPRNELLRVVNQYPSKDEVRTKVLKDILAVNPTDKYDVFSKPNNAYALTRASEDLGIPLESIGFSVDPNSDVFRLKGSLYTDSTAIDNARTLVGRVASTQAKAGNPYVYNQLKRKQEFFAQPRSHSKIAVDGTEGVEAILEAYNKAEPRRTANSQGNRPILNQAGGLDANISIPTGSPENIPWDNVEGMRGFNAYKPAEELKRPRFIDEGTGIYTRQGEPINAEQKALLDTGMADLEDRSFILRPQERAMASPLPVEYFFSKDDWAESKGLPIGSMQPNTEQYRPTTRLGLQALGLSENVGRETITPSVEIGDTLYPSNSTVVRRATPINRLTDDLSDRVLSGDVDLRNYEPFKSNNTPQYYLDQSKDFVGPIRAVKDTTYGTTQGKTPWREYYSDPFVYEDKGLDSEVNRLVKAVNETPAQLENALSNQAVANRKAMELETAIQSFRRIAKGGKKADISMSPEMMIELAEVAPRIREWKSQRRNNEVGAAKAQDRIAELRASQELLGTEYMVKPKKWGEDVLSGYRIGSDTIGGVRDSNEVPINDKFSEEVFDKLIVSQDPSLVKGKVARRVVAPNSVTVKPNAVQALREAIQQEELDNRRDYDIASLFGFSGNY